MRLVIILATTALLLAGCSETPDEEQIADNIAAIEEAVEGKSFDQIQQYLHADFLANDRMGAMEAKRLLAMYGRQHRKLGVTIVGSKTILDPTYPDRADTTLSVVVTGSSGRLPSDGSVRSVRLEWIKDGGEWLIRRANWQR
jgi:hypothetical protein